MIFFITDGSCPFLNLSNEAVLFDKDGFLLPGWFLDWDKKVAEHIAAREGVCWLVETHWLAINFVRRYYITNAEAPSAEEIANVIKVRPGELACYFTYGAKTAWKIAGLPRSRCFLWEIKERGSWKCCTPACPQCEKSDDVVIITVMCAALGLEINDSNPATNYCGRCDKEF